MRNSLGISLGTRLVGMAVSCDGDLLDFRMRTFYGAWTEIKQGQILAAIRSTIRKFGITVLTVKTPKPSHVTQGIQGLIQGIRELAEHIGIKVTICTIAMLTARYNDPKRRTNRQALSQAIMRKYAGHPQLQRLYSKEQENTRLYYMKIFEAIACTELA